MSKTQPNTQPPITVGISACLLGQTVRYDGGHKRLPFACDELSRHFEFIPICPEQAIGLGVPRPTIRLVGDPDNPRVQGTSDATLDVTEQLDDFARKTSATLTDISGYLFCAKSPSCGMERVPVYDEKGHAVGKVGVGAYARRLMEAHPLLPVEENGRLNDIPLRENFVLRVIAYHRWQSLVREGLTTHRLQQFHRRHKFLLLAHNQNAYRQLGPLVADTTDDSLEDHAALYIERFMKALSKPASVANHRNTLQHIQGFFRKQLQSDDRQHLEKVIADYANGLLPLLVPLEMLAMLLRKYQIDYLLDQYYFDPYPKDLRLRVGL